MKINSPSHIIHPTVLRPTHSNGNHLVKSPNPLHSVYSTEKDYDDQRFQHSCDTQDYGLEGGVKSPTNSSYYGDHSPNQNLNGVIGNIHLVRAKTEEVSSYDGHQLLKSSSLVHLGDELGMHHHHQHHISHDSNNNSSHNSSSESFLNLVPPPPHLAAELGRKCMAFNAEQVNI